MIVTNKTANIKPWGNLDKNARAEKTPAGISFLLIKKYTAVKTKNEETISVNM